MICGRYNRPLYVPVLVYLYFHSNSLESYGLAERIFIKREMKNINYTYLLSVQHINILTPPPLFLHPFCIPKFLEVILSGNWIFLFVKSLSLCFYHDKAKWAFSTAY